MRASLSADRRAEKGIITIWRFPSDILETPAGRSSQEWAEIYKGIKDEESEEEEEEVRGAGRQTWELSAVVVNFHYPLLKEPHIIQVRAGGAPTQLGWESSGAF